jgi:hypothetical protein
MNALVIMRSWKAVDLQGRAVVGARTTTGERCLVALSGFKVRGVERVRLRRFHTSTRRGIQRVLLAGVAVLPLNERPDIGPVHR